MNTLTFVCNMHLTCIIYKHPHSTHTTMFVHALYAPYMHDAQACAMHRNAHCTSKRTFLSTNACTLQLFPDNREALIVQRNETHKMVAYIGRASVAFLITRVARHTKLATVVGPAHF